MQQNPENQKTILLATTNAGKVRELQALLASESLKILCLKDMPASIEVEEDKPTFYENAYKKARVYSEFFNLPVIADDSGLVVPALKGEPGVYSARYAGIHASDEENLQLLLTKMSLIQERRAYFECSMVYFESSKSFFSAAGRCYGEILREQKGSNGFGYDPVFYLPENRQTLAEMSLEEKNQISHRKHALSNLLQKMKSRGVA